MRIVYGPPFDSTRTVVFYRDVLHADIKTNSTTLYLVPTIRKQVQVLATFALDSGGIPPRIKTFDFLVESLFHRFGNLQRTLSVQASRMILYQFLHTKYPAGTPGLYMEAVNSVLRLRREGIRSDVLLQILEPRDDRMILDGLVYYEDLLVRNQWEDAGGTTMLVADQLAGRMDKPDGHWDPPWERIIVDGFLDFSQPQIDILNQFATDIDIIFFWQGDRHQPDLFAPAVTLFESNFHPITWIENRAWKSESSPLSSLARNLFSSGSKNRVDTGHHLRILESGNLRDEIIRIAADIKSRFILTDSEKPSRSWDRICVTFPNLKEYAPYIRWIFKRFRIPCNLSSRLPLHSSAAGTAIQTILASALEFDRDTVFDLLCHPLLSQPSPLDSRRIVDRLDYWSERLKLIGGSEGWFKRLEFHSEKMRKRGYSGVAEELTIIRKGLIEVVKRLEPLRKSMTFAAFLVELESVCIQFELEKNSTCPESVPSDRDQNNYTIPSHATKRMMEYIRQMISSDKDTDLSVQSPEENRNTLFKLLEQEEFQIPIQRSAQIQVLGMLETRGLTFDHIYIGGLTESGFPRPESPPLFWSKSIWDTVLGKEGFTPRYHAETDLVRLLHSACESVTISWPHVEGDSIVLGSTIIEDLISGSIQIDTVPSTEETLCLKDDLVRCGALLRDPKPTSWPDYEPHRNAIAGCASELDRFLNKAPFNGTLKSVCSLKSLRRKFGPEKALSASQLEMYLKCPMQFFFSYACGLDKPVEPSEEMEPVVRGQFIHKVLQTFYSRRIKENKGRVTHEELEEAEIELDTIARTIFSDMGDENMFSLKELVLFTGNTETGQSGLATDFLANEASTPPSLEPKYLEWQFGTDSDQLRENACVLSRPGIDQVMIQGKIDRIDCSNDSAVIFDYKIGKLPPLNEVDQFINADDSTTANLKVIQIGIYLLAARQLLNLNPSGGFYYQLSRKSGCRIAPVIGVDTTQEISAFFSKRTASRQVDRDRIEAYLNRIETICLSAAEQLRAGFFNIDPDEKTCRYCSFSHLCRISEFDSSRLTETTDE
jgi:ATP-dependent helicase/nuclease subunit B